MKLRSALLALLASFASFAAPGLRLEGEPFLPYRINHAVASREDGVLGNLELEGQRWDGSRVALFRTHVKARSQTVDLAFYLDEDIRSLLLHAEGRGTSQSFALELAAADVRGGVMTAEETALRNRMRRLNPPVYLAPSGEAPEHFSLLGSELVMAGLQAASSLFRLPVNWAPLGLLGGFAGVALILAGIPPGALVWKRLARMLVAGVATLAIAVGADRRPTLFSVTFPGDGPDARLSGTFERRVDERSGYTRVAYTAGQEPGTRALDPGSVDLVGLWAPVGPGIPLGEVVPQGSLARFSAPLLVTGAEGDVFIGSKGFVTGWVVHASR